MSRLSELAFAMVVSAVASVGPSAPAWTAQSPAAVQPQSSGTPNDVSTSASEPAPASGAPDKSLLQSSKEALPALVTAIIVAFLGWAIGLRLTASWDLRKKRQELEIAAIFDFNRVVAEFKAVGREREFLFKRRSQMPDQPPDDSAATLELHKRAVAAESGLEVILLKLLVDTDAWLAAQDILDKPAVKRHQLRTFALLRLMFRTMRENISDAAYAPPGFMDPELWLFNRLAAEVAGIVYERAANPAIPSLWRPWKITAVIAKPDADAYLKLVSYRTTDLRQAVAMMGPALASYSAARDAARLAARRANVMALLDRSKLLILEDTDLPHANPGNGVTTLVHFVRLLPDNNRPPGLDDLFDSFSDLTSYLGVTDRPPRVHVIAKGGAMRIVTELDSLPDDLPFARPGQWRGIDMLRWEPTSEVDAALAHVASVSLGVTPRGASG